MKTTYYRVKQMDTIENLAQKFLGDASRWWEIVQANNLRSPFISDDPLDHIGIILYRGTFTTNFPAGTTQFMINMPSPQIAQKHGLFHVRQDRADLIRQDETSV